MSRSVEEMVEFLDANEDEYIKFEHVKEPRSARPDVHAFILLEKLSPTTTPPGRSYGEDMVSAAEHDRIWLSSDPRFVATNATDEELLDLQRCGVAYDEDDESFYMFV